MTADAYDADQRPPALGSVVEEGRGSLPFHLIHGEALVACASWALGEAGVMQVDIGTNWAGIVEADEPFVLHDSLCPMMPASFIADCLAAAVGQDTIVVGIRPVTDTVKEVAEGFVGDTVDRADLVQVASPVVLPARVVAELDGFPSLDFAELVATLRATHPVELRLAPPEGRRVGSDEEIRVLEGLTRGDWRAAGPRGT